MPIRGLTDRAASFPQIGVLRKGAPKQEGSNRPGKDLEHFRFDTEDTQAAADFETAYGGSPTSIRVYLPFVTTAENFDAWQEAWTAGALQHRCDGQTCAIWLNGKSYSMEPKPCPGGCKPAGRLKVIIPELRRMAFVMVVTSSIHDIMTIQSNLEALEVLRGSLRGIPLILARRPREISTPDDKSGKRVRREKWLITIEAAPTWVDLQLTAMERAALPMLQAPAGAERVDTMTGEIVEVEPEPPAPNGGLQMTPAEAEQRFFARYSETVGGEDWPAVQGYLKSRAPKPTTVDGWIAAAEAVRDQAAKSAPDSTEAPA